MSKIKFLVCLIFFVFAFPGYGEMEAVRRAQQEFSQQRYHEGLMILTDLLNHDEVTAREKAEIYLAMADFYERFAGSHERGHGGV